MQLERHGVVTVPEGVRDHLQGSFSASLWSVGTPTPPCSRTCHVATICSHSSFAAWSASNIGSITGPRTHRVGHVSSVGAGDGLRKEAEPCARQFLGGSGNDQVGEHRSHIIDGTPEHVADGSALAAL